MGAWTGRLTSTVDATRGQIGIELYSMTAIATNDAGSPGQHHISCVAGRNRAGNRRPARAFDVAGRPAVQHASGRCPGRFVLGTAIDRLSIQTNAAALGFGAARGGQPSVRTAAGASRPTASDHPNLTVSKAQRC